MVDIRPVGVNNECVHEEKTTTLNRVAVSRSRHNLCDDVRAGVVVMLYQDKHNLRDDVVTEVVFVLVQHHTVRTTRRFSSCTIEIAFSS